MRSDRIVDGLGSTRLSLFLGFGTTVLLLAASFFVPNPRGPDALPFNESVAHFFERPSLSYTWFYILFGVTALYGLNGLLGTWRSWISRRASGSVDRRYVGVLLMHLGFLTGLVAHLVAGFGTEVEEQVTLTSTPTDVAGRKAKVTDAVTTQNANGTMRTFSAKLDLGGGDIRSLGFNDPVFFDGFRRWILVQGPQEVGGTPSFSYEGRLLSEAEGQWRAGESRYVVQRLSRHKTLKAPMVLVQRVDVPDQESQWLGAGMATPDGLTFEGLTPELGVSVVVRRNDGLPLVGLGSLIFTLGLGIFSWETRRKA